MRVFVTGIEDAASLNTVSVLDGLTKSNAAWRFSRDPDAPDLFEVMAVGTSANPIRFINGVRLHPSAIAKAADPPDLVVVPGLDDNVRPSVDRNRHWVPWLQGWAEEGAIVASSCTGAFLLAEAGLLDGRRATTHWVAEGLFRATYPRVRLQIDQIVIDEGNVITTGGATTAFNLVHYLVARFGSADRARATTQMMLLDSGRDSQLPFAMVGLHRDHGDPLIHDAQSGRRNASSSRPRDRSITSEPTSDSPTRARSGGRSGAWSAPHPPNTAAATVATTGILPGDHNCPAVPPPPAGTQRRRGQFS